MEIQGDVINMDNVALVDRASSYQIDIVFLGGFVKTYRYTEFLEANDDFKKLSKHLKKKVKQLSVYALLIYIYIYIYIIFMSKWQIIPFTHILFNYSGKYTMQYIAKLNLDEDTLENSTTANLMFALALASQSEDTDSVARKDADVITAELYKRGVL